MGWSRAIERPHLLIVLDQVLVGVMARKLVTRESLRAIRPESTKGLGWQLSVTRGGPRFKQIS